MGGHHSYRAVFQEGGIGTQTNVLTGTERRLRRRGANTNPALSPARALEPGICGRDQLPPVLDHEVEFTVQGCGAFTMGQPVRSESCTVGDFRYRLLVFPHGTNGSGEIS